jgi:hypothetical protein
MAVYATASAVSTCRVPTIDLHMLGGWSGPSSTITRCYADSVSRDTLRQRGGSVHGFNAVFRAIMSPVPGFIDGIFGGPRFEDLAGRACTLSEALAAAVEVQISHSQRTVLMPHALDLLLTPPACSCRSCVTLKVHKRGQVRALHLARCSCCGKLGSPSPRCATSFW